MNPAVIVGFILFFHGKNVGIIKIIINFAVKRRLTV